jgi:hypothetical protein
MAAAQMKVVTTTAVLRREALKTVTPVTPRSELSCVPRAAQAREAGAHVMCYTTAISGRT